MVKENEQREGERGCTNHRCEDLFWREMERENIQHLSGWIPWQHNRVNNGNDRWGTFTCAAREMGDCDSVISSSSASPEGGVAMMVNIVLIMVGSSPCFNKL